MRLLEFNQFIDSNHKAHDNMHLGEMQNHAEGGDHWVNHNYRILTHDPDKGPHHYESNKEGGIFPPLFDHDHEGHQWSHVGHVRDIKPGEFQHLTKTKEHPKGITHKDFMKSLMRQHNRNNGKHWTGSEAEEKRRDHIDEHPLVQRFNDYHDNTGHSPIDYHQKKNLGVFEHPDGSNHIVARDHGFSTDVANAYQKANMAKSKSQGRHNFGW